jgi:hypothetical protein
VYVGVGNFLKKKILYALPFLRERLEKKFLLWPLNACREKPFLVLKKVVFPGKATVVPCVAANLVKRLLAKHLFFFFDAEMVTI